MSHVRPFHDAHLTCIIVRKVVQDLCALLSRVIDMRVCDTSPLTTNYDKILRDGLPGLCEQHYDSAMHILWCLGHEKSQHRLTSLLFSAHEVRTSLRSPRSLHYSYGVS